MACFAALVERSHVSKQAREKEWAAADPNGNGYCSLAEIDSWVKKLLIDDLKSADEGERMWQLHRPCYIRAFTDAADAMEDKRVEGTKSATADDYVQRKEFRLLCAYLCIYARMFEAFDRIDGGSAGTAAADDRRISLEEWLESYSKVTNRGFVGLESLSDADQSAEAAEAAKLVFKEMDSDGKGMVLLDEWCAFLKRKEQEAGTAVGKLLSTAEPEDRNDSENKKESNESDESNESNGEAGSMGSDQADGGEGKDADSNPTEDAAGDKDTKKASSTGLSKQPQRSSKECRTTKRKAVQP